MPASPGTQCGHGIDKSVGYYCNRGITSRVCTLIKPCGKQGKWGERERWPWGGDGACGDGQGQNWMSAG